MYEISRTLCTNTDSIYQKMNTKQKNSIARGVRFDHDVHDFIEKKVEEIEVTTFNRLVNHFLRKMIKAEQIKKGEEVTV